MGRNAYVVYVRPDDLMTLLHNWKFHEFVCLPEMTGAARFSDGTKVDIPKDARVDAVAWLWEQQMFGFRVCHPSFPSGTGGVSPEVLLLRETTVEPKQMAPLSTRYILESGPEADTPAVVSGR